MEGKWDRYRSSHPHDTVPASLHNFHSGEERKKNRSVRRQRSRKLDADSLTSSESSNGNYQQNVRQRKTRDSKSRVKRGAELIRAQIMSKGSGSSLNPSLSSSVSNEFVLNDLEDSLMKINAHNQKREMSPESPRSVTQFHQKEINSSDKRQQERVKHFKLTSILKQSSFGKSSKTISTKPATLEAFPPKAIRESVAFRHAQKAGLLWQTIVGTFVRFPTVWFNGSRSPEMGIPNNDSVIPKWHFVCLLRLQDKFISSQIQDRRSSGKLLLHLIITDAEEGEIRDIAIGCFHPKAKNVYSNNQYVEANLENALPDDSYRDVWMALRKTNGREKQTFKSKDSWLEKFLTSGQSIESVGRASPISEDKKSIGNENVRSVFGHAPPLETVLLSKSVLKNAIKQIYDTTDRDDTVSPAFLLLKFFLFRNT